MIRGTSAFAWLSVNFIFVAQALFAQVRFEIAPAPAWVAPLASLPEPCFLADSGASIYLLREQQVNLAEHTFYYHFAKKILSDQFLDEERTVVDYFVFNPEYQKLRLHQLQVWRNDEAHDRLGARALVFEPANEDSLTRLYEASQWTAIMLDSLSAGDVIDYAFSLQGANPIGQNRFATTLELQTNSRVCLIRHRLLAPRGRRLFFKNRNTALAPSRTEHAGFVEYLWQQHEVAPEDYEFDSPSWHDSKPAIQISAYENWSEVAQWATAHFRAPTALPPGLNKKLDALAARYEKSEERVIATLRLVQQEINTVPIAWNEIARKPAAPHVVFARGYGNEAEKALLFCAMLQRLGVTAHPALVHTARRHTLDEDLPSPAAFNHVAVQVCLPNNIDKWFEPTQWQQGGTFWNTQFPRYDRALVLRPETESLLDIAGKAYVNHHLEVQENFSLPEYGAAAVLHVTATYDDANADWLRSYLVELDSTERRDFFKREYTSRHEQVEAVTAEQVTDDTLANRIVVRAHYTIADFWKQEPDSLHVQASFYAEHTFAYLQVTADSMRRAPLALEHPVRIKHMITANLPERLFIKSERGAVRDSSFEFRYEYWGGKELFLTYDYHTLAEEVSAARVREHMANRQRALEKAGYAVTKSLRGRAKQTSRTYLWIMLPLALAAGVWYWLLAKLLQKKSPAKTERI